MIHSRFAEEGWGIHKNIVNLLHTFHAWYGESLVCFCGNEDGKRFLIRNFKIQNTPGVNITISNSGKASHATHP